MVLVMIIDGDLEMTVQYITDGVGGHYDGGENCGDNCGRDDD